MEGPVVPEAKCDTLWKKPFPPHIDIEPAQGLYAWKIE